MSEENTQQSAEEIWQQEAAKLEAGDTPAPEVVPEVAAPSEEEVPQAEPEPEPQPEVSDPLDGLPDAVKAKLAEIDELKKANAQLLHHVKSTEGRVAAMQREAQIARQAAKAADDAPTSGQIAAASKNPEKWEALKQDFPEWSEAMEEYVSAKLATQPRTESAVSAQQIAGYVQQQVAQTRAEMQKAFEESRVEDRHGDWKQTVQTQEFVSWFQMQSPEVRALAQSNAAKDAIRMLDMYEQAKTKPAKEVKQERSARLAAAATTPRGQTTPPAKSLDDMSAEELWNYEAKQRARTAADRGF